MPTHCAGSWPAKETVTLIVAHEHALRHVAEAAGSVRRGGAIANALLSLFDENAVRGAA
jgi:Flp pilus assembly protein protease CpaA